MSDSFGSSAAGKAMAAVLRASPEFFMDATRQVNRTQVPEEVQRTYSEAEQRQMNGGFSGLFLEAIDGTSNDVRIMLIETMIPGLIMKGNTPEGIVRWTSGFMVSIACAMMRALPAEHHDAASEWLSLFSADYLVDVGRSARAASESQ